MFLTGILDQAWNSWSREYAEALTFLLEKIKDVLFIFLHHIFLYYILETIKQ